MKLNFNLNEVPDKVQPVEPGEYDGTIDKIELQEAQGKRKEQYSFTISIASDGPMKGRKLFDGFPTEYLADPKSSTSVKLGHLAKSAGYVPENPNEFDLEALVNKSIRFTVSHRQYKDDDGVMQTAANLKDYLYTK